MGDDRTRVRRHIEEAENAALGQANRTTPAAPAPSTSGNTDPDTGIKFYGGKVTTPEQKAKSGKALQDLLNKRSEADDDSGTATA